eukprot:TRINITY_DN20811_c0_g1_i1.p1 TRINITY_DN20811_c0_g1~~TRINITY_DN20811_c0_g1_i1.p1  ORF type:complete len:311 (-),score=61.02 TRINITY_DN20811_c0_g1_i1:41-973(-)
MLNGRERDPLPSLETTGFQLEHAPTAVTDFSDTTQIAMTYYTEMREVVKRATGATRVLVFDHTVRSSEATSLNALEAGAVAAAVPRVHADYTDESAPRRLQQFGEAGIFSLKKNRHLSAQEVRELARHRFAFVNVWRGITEAPIERMPLACCDTNSVEESDRFLYELLFPDRVGQNYSMQFNPSHRWYYFPKQTKDECLVFKTYDKKQDGPRFVFHTAFHDPRTPADAPPRRSIEVRAIAFFAPQSGEMEVTEGSGDDLSMHNMHSRFCLLYTSDAADEEDSVDLGGRRIIKKKKESMIIDQIKNSEIKV